MTSSLSQGSHRDASYFLSKRFLDRPLPASPLVAEIGRDISRLLDAHNEAENNAARGEAHFLRVNLAVCFDLAKRIQSRRKEARALLAKAKGGQ